MSSVWYISTFAMLINYDCLILVYTMILSLRQAFQGLTPNGSFCLPSMLKLKEHQCSQDAWMFWGRKEPEYLSVIVDNGTLRLTHDKLAAVRNWSLPNTQKHIKYFVHYSYFVDCIPHYSDGAATLTNLCHKNVLGNVVHTKVTLKFLKLGW
jgi:hypothetical protein